MRTKDQLIEECEKRGVQHKHPIYSMQKKDLELILAEEASLPQISVMKAYDFKDLPIDKQEEILDDPNWVAEEKINGVHCKSHLLQDGLHLDGRKKSDVTFTYIERTDSFPHLHKVSIAEIPYGTVIDCEIFNPNESINTGSVITEGTLTSTTSIWSSEPERAVEIQKSQGPCYLYVFDIIRVGGLKADSIFRQRRDLLESFFDRFSNVFKEHHIHLIKQYTDKRKAFKEITERGGEGVMLKNLNGYYEEGKDSRYQYKWKKIYTVDGWISDYVKGKKESAFANLVGSLVISAYDKKTKKEVIIGCVQPGDMAQRIAMTNKNGELKTEYYGRVVEMSFYSLTKNKRGQHATLERWRPDKGQKDCWIDFSKFKVMEE